jgi:hypothetical protein
VVDSAAGALVSREVADFHRRALGQIAHALASGV